MASDDEIKTLLGPARIVGFGLMASVAVYAVIGAIVSTTGPGAGLPPTMLFVFGGVAVVLAGAIPVVRRSMMPPAPGADAHADSVKATVARFFTATIVTMAMAEAIAILGLIATFLTHDLRFVLVAAGVTLALMAQFFPRASLLGGARE